MKLIKPRGLNRGFTIFLLLASEWESTRNTRGRGQVVPPVLPLLRRHLEMIVRNDGRKQQKKYRKQMKKMGMKVWCSPTLNSYSASHDN